MALMFNGTSPTRILVEHPSQNFQVNFPSGPLTVYKYNEGTINSPDYRYRGSLIEKTAYNFNSVKLNGALVDENFVTINTDGDKTWGETTRTARYLYDVLELTVYYEQATSSLTPDIKTVGIPSYSATATPCIDLAKVKVVKNGTTTVVWEKLGWATTWMGSYRADSVVTTGGFTDASGKYSGSATKTLTVAGGYIEDTTLETKIIYTVDGGAAQMLILTSSDELLGSGSATLNSVTSNVYAKLTSSGIIFTTHSKSSKANTKTPSAVEVVITKIEQNRVMKTLSTPVVLSANFGSQQDILVSVANSNNVDVTCYVTFYDVSDTVYGSGSFLVGANSTVDNESIPLDSSGEFESGAYVTCYFTASGYTQSKTTTHSASY